MFYRMIKLMREDFGRYILQRNGKYCYYCPENKCVLCVEEKKYLHQCLNNKKKEQK